MAVCPREAISAGPKRTVALSQQHAHGVTSRVGDDKVGFAVAVDVGHRQRIWLGSDQHRVLDGEGPVSFTNQHADCVVVVIVHQKIRDAVAVDIGNHDPARTVADGEGVLYAE